jgi:hypothetical protein
MGGAGLEPERYQFLWAPLGMATQPVATPLLFYIFYFQKKKKTIFKFYLFIFLIYLYFFIVMDMCRFSIGYNVTK